MKAKNSTSKKKIDGKGNKKVERKKKVKDFDKLLEKLEPAMLKFQPKLIGPKDHVLLKEWERLVTKRFGLTTKVGATVSKTLDSCPGGGLDMTDTD